MRERRPRPSEVALAAALCLAGAAFAPARAGANARDEGAPAAGGALHVTADPPRLVLGRDAGAELRVTAAPDVEEITLTVSGGRVEDVRRLPGGGFAARYRPPGERVPQVAIVAAVGRSPRGVEDGWLAIPLSGQGDARVRAAPGAEITLRIGERAFGPRRAGADGVAVIPVVVPPGVRQAHHGFTPIDLHVPETPLLHAVLDRGAVLADRTEKVRVLAVVVAPHGAARRGDIPVFEVSRGTVSAFEREPGAIEAVWTLPPGRAGEERLALRLAASPASRAVLKLDAVAGPAAVVAVAFDREALAADATDGAAVVARAQDAAGNLVPASLALAADGGELTRVRAREPGEIEARLAIDGLMGARRSVRVTATAPGLGISGSRLLPLTPGAPAEVRFDGADGVVRADGSRSAVLRVAVADRLGNPVGVAPAVVAERGEVLAVEPGDDAGTWEVRYVGPRVDGPTPERLVATVGKARATAERVLLPPEPRFRLAAAAGAAADLRGRSAGPVATLAFETPSELAAPVRRGLALSWRGEVHALGVGDGAAAALLAGASASRAVGPNLILRAGATAGLVLTGGSASPAARLAAEVGLARGRLAPFAELSLLGAGDGAPGAFAAVGLSAGVRFGLESGHGDHPDRR